jgi:transposase
MSRKTKRVLTDEHWARIVPHLPTHTPSPKGGRPRANDRECMEGILWLLRSGARWQDVPADLPSGSTCWRRLQEWAGDDVLENIHTVLIEELRELGALDFEELVADATFVRAKKGAMTSGTPRLARV